MAKMSYEMPEKFIEGLGRLQSEYDEVVGEVLQQGAKPLYDKTKENLKNSIGKNLKKGEEYKGTGDLLKSLATTRPYMDKNENWQIKVGCVGYDRKGVANPLKAAVLEHGSSKQNARPWARPAANAAKAECIERMQKVLDEEVAKRLL